MAKQKLTLAQQKQLAMAQQQQGPQGQPPMKRGGAVKKKR